MLLNLSNHPSPNWSDAQRKTAEALYGRVEDLAFPNISPHWAKEQVEDLAREYATKIRAMNPSAVHLMGEMTFTFALTGQLKNAGIPCLASTTERIVTEENGKKIVQFQFIRFREY